MQGRLSDVVDGKIQAFPWQFWRDEFEDANKIGIPLMEWTLDQLYLYRNPIMTTEGRLAISQLSEENNLKIPSLTGDCFMQAPFWKADAGNRNALVDDFHAIVSACSSLNINIIVVPLVDNGALTSKKEEKLLVDILADHEANLAENGVKVAFESDYTPAKLERFIGEMDPNLFGINYDIGNSAALGFDVGEEFTCYGDRILNVHVKDRAFGGTTVPLGQGDADFEAVFSKLSEYSYPGNYILQTARDPLGMHSNAIENYQKMLIEWISKYES